MARPIYLCFWILHMKDKHLEWARRRLEPSLPAGGLRSFEKVMEALSPYLLYQSDQAAHFLDSGEIYCESPVVISVCTSLWF